MLYVGIGDGGGANDPGQRPGPRPLLGKILRIDVDGGRQRPPARPARQPLRRARRRPPRDLARGLRNPWRFAFDPANGDLWIGDVGQNAWEEIDVARSGQKGLKFGWHTMEGFECFNPSDGCDPAGLTLPVAAYGRDLGCAVVGGVVVHDAAQSAIDGLCVLSDDCSGDVWTMGPVGDERREPTLALKSGRGISAIGQAEDGAVYMVDLGCGELLRLVAG